MDIIKDQKKNHKYWEKVKERGEGAQSGLKLNSPGA